MYQAMGGVTGFTSLVDGVDKLQLDEERNIRRPRIAAGSDGRVKLAEPSLEDNNSGEKRGRVSAASRSPTAAELKVAGDDRKQRELRRGKLGEGDEMALYEQKYKKTMSVRSRTGLRPVTPQRVEDDSTRFGSGTPRRSSFNTSMTTASAAARPTSSTSTASSSRRTLSGRSSAAASPSGSATSSGTSTPRRSSGIARKPAVPIQSTRRGSGTQSAADKKS